MKNFPERYRVAMNAAIVAGERILEIYDSPFDSTLKDDGSPVTIADLASSSIIIDLLTSTEIPIIGEEKINLPFAERKDWSLNWCVDPLDGTKEFIKKNGEFAVNIALIEKHQAIFGLITEPCKGRMIAGGLGLGVHIWDYINDPEMTTVLTIQNSLKMDDSIVWIGSRSHPNFDKNWITRLEEAFVSVEKISKGSALKFFDLALEDAQIYPRFAPTMEWDIAAGHALLRELGGTIVSLETGKELEYNKESLFNPHFVAKTNAFLEREKKFSTLRPL
ncbi:MAG: 3'(2'),5'-bisphosphate nucleotidase CysQ [Crocinitomicaceae bacterium]